jgi:branched-chain amino acid aminotransferase
LEKSPPGISSNDAALGIDFLNQVSCFETLRAYGGEFFHAPEHLRRLEESCRGMGRVLPAKSQEIILWLEEALRESGCLDAILRFSIHWKNLEEGEWVAMVREFKSHPAEWHQKGVELKTAVSRRWGLRSQDSQIKASSFVTGVMAYLDQPDAAHEFIFLGQGGTLAEGTVSNIFVAREKRLLTPSVASGILRGVTRGVVIDLARARGLEVVETFLTRHEIYSAAECFMTNTSSEILPVVKVDGRVIGNGAPGFWTVKLASDFKEYHR